MKEFQFIKSNITGDFYYIESNDKDARAKLYLDYKGNTRINYCEFEGKFENQEESEVILNCLVKSNQYAESKNIKYVHIWDCRKLYMNALTRKIFADHTKEKKIWYNKWDKTSIVITDSAVTRGIISALNWVGGVAVPTRAAKDIPQALMIANEILKS